MKGRQLVTAVLSLLVPGLGQIVAGKGSRGAAILTAAIVVGNLNLIFVLAFTAANPDAGSPWSYRLLRVGHDIMALWSIVFWVWAIADAYRHASR